MYFFTLQFLIYQMLSLPKQLLAYSQKDDLIICWFAATLSEKSFKKRYKSAVINKINIEELWYIILPMIAIFIFNIQTFI